VQLVTDGDERRQSWVDVVLTVSVGRFGVQVDAADEAQTPTVGATQHDDGLGQRDGIPDGARQVQLMMVVQEQDPCIRLMAEGCAGLQVDGP
jgi:hypothetical protein